VLAGSRDLLKVKEWYTAEAVVLRSNRLLGKDSLHVRCLTGEAPGVVFDVAWARPTLEPPLPSTVLTYRYQRGLQNGVPRFPGLVRVHKTPCDCGACAFWEEERRHAVGQ
jgi:hypothetical protein